ncbi:hypothetical protein LCGC14_0571170 [marine sediment metagenome]|uniref:Transmembrane protein n=1 Tax=marine sediment metagenome TaxID=412755 RepID=A0A0F9RP84_9ZZZZ
MQSAHKNILTVLLVSVLLFTSVSALVYKQNSPAVINLVCINAGFCSSSAQCNVSVFSPAGNVILDGVQATQSASLANYNVTLNENQTIELGEYQVGGFCIDGSVTQLIDFTFEVTPTGFSNIFDFYLIILIVSAVVIIFGFWIRDPWVVMFGTFGLYFVGIFIIRFGIVGLKDNDYTFTLGLIIIGIAAYLSIKTGIELLDGLK